MKTLFESWNKYIKEDVDVEIGDEDTILYHISSVPDIEILDPEIAAKGHKNYTSAEYKAWNRPRVFYFTRWGQEDVGIGRIQGHPYQVKIKSNELYPVMQDPLKLSYPDMKEKYMELTGDSKFSPGTLNTFERVATLADKLHNYKGFIYPQSGNRDNMIVALWKPVPAERLDKSFYNKEEN
jgi:hypothetical protein